MMSIEFLTSWTRYVLEGIEMKIFTYIYVEKDSDCKGKISIGIEIK